MIDRDCCGVYSLACDVCGREADETFSEFCDAVEYKKQNGWRSQKHRGEWEDVCPECQELTRNND